MALKLSKSKAELTGEVVVDDAEALYQWLAAHPKGSVSLGKLTHMHTAVVQALAAAPRPITAMPADPFLAQCLRQLTAQQQDN